MTDPLLPPVSVLRDGLTRLDLTRDDGRETAWLAAVPGAAFPDLEPRAGEWLAPAELAYLARLDVPRRRKSYLLGRVAAKRAVLRYLGETDPRAVAVERGVFQQPVVRAVGPDVPGVSISHTEDWAVAVAHPAGHPVAVDIETLTPDRAATVRAHLTPEEAALLRDGVPEIVVWAMKEALGKVLRCGLMVPLDVLAVGGLAPGPGGRTLGTFRNFLQYRAIGWCEAGHAVAVVLPRATAVGFSLG
ncbi:MAG: 4'-phosphopantetheinyl transferase family protein [Fimbriiglobus sp.]